MRKKEDFRQNENIMFPLVLVAIIGILIIAGIVQFYIAENSKTEIESTGEVNLEMRVLQGQWTWEPNEIIVPYGSKVIIDIYNEDGYAHGFAIQEFGVNYYLDPQTTTKVEFIADQTGEFTFRCSVQCGAGHFTQTGKIIVTGEGTIEQGNQHSTSPTDYENPLGLPVKGKENAKQYLDYQIVDGVKVFELTAEHIMWDYGGGKIVESYAYNGQLPGPEIRVTKGDRIKVVFTNNLPEETTIHWHGLDVPFDQDGVPHVTQQPIQPGETYTYEFTVEQEGTRMYHTHVDGGDNELQLDKGLAGPFIVEPENYEAPDLEKVMVLTERISNSLYPIDGYVFPYTEPLEVTEGDIVKIRLIGAGSSTEHPMHMHGHQFRVVAKDGNDIPIQQQEIRNTLVVSPGETYDIEFEANNPGVWLYHCHQLYHARYGMVTIIKYEGYEPVGDVTSAH